MVCVSLLGCCMKTSSWTLQKKPHPNQSTSSQRESIKLTPADATVSLVGYTPPKARQRGVSITSRQPSGYHPLSTGTTSSSGAIMAWHTCFTTKTGLKTRTLKSNTPNHTRSMTCTSWVAQCISRPYFGTTKTGLQRRSQRLRVPLMLLRRSGPWRIWRRAETSSVISRRRWNRLPLVDRTSMVSSRIQRTSYIY